MMSVDLPRCYYMHSLLTHYSISFENHYTQTDSRDQEEICIADHLQALITRLDNDLNESGTLLNNHYGQNLICTFPKL